MAEGRGEFQLSQAKLKRKFENVAARVLPLDRVTRAFETIMAMESIASIHKLTGLLGTSVVSIEQAAE